MIWTILALKLRISTSSEVDSLREDVDEIFEELDKIKKLILECPEIAKKKLAENL